MYLLSSSPSSSILFATLTKQLKKGKQGLFEDTAHRIREDTMKHEAVHGIHSQEAETQGPIFILLILKFGTAACGMVPDTSNVIFLLLLAQSRKFFTDCPKVCLLGGYRYF